MDHLLKVITEPDFDAALFVTMCDKYYRRDFLSELEKLDFQFNTSSRNYVRMLDDIVMDKNFKMFKWIILKLIIQQYLTLFFKI